MSIALRGLPSLLRRAAPSLLRQAAPALVALALALLARYLVVEPAPIAHDCDPRPWSGLCTLRTLLIASFSTQGLGWVALAAGVVATLLRSRRLAQLALFFGASGLVLYSFESSAVGALLGMLVLVRVRRPGSPAQAAA